MASYGYGSSVPMFSKHRVPVADFLDLICLYLTFVSGKAGEFNNFIYPRIGYFANEIWIRKNNQRILRKSLIFFIL
jgi:hypothetical protein